MGRPRETRSYIPHPLSLLPLPLRERPGVRGRKVRSRFSVPRTRGVMQGKREGRFFASLSMGIMAKKSWGKWQKVV